jgi:hypothetical protein
MRKCKEGDLPEHEINGLEHVETMLLPGKQVRAFSKCDQKSDWYQPAPPAKAREPYDSEVVKRWTAEITKTIVTQRELSLTDGIRMFSATMDCEL